MSQNIGTLVSAAIRPNDSLDPIASAFAREIKGGLHTATSSSDRNLTIFERREWGMMCYVINDDKTYQLKYNYSSTSIMDNSNWVEFSGAGGGSGGGEWLDSVLSVNYTQPGSPINGDRYLVGLKPGDVLTGGVWGAYSPGYVVEWNSVLTSWDTTTPLDGMSVRVDNEDNSIYRYEGVYPTGVWGKEKLGQVRSLTATTVNGATYSSTSTPIFNSYLQDMIFLTEFSSQNTGHTASLNINGLGAVLIKKPTPSGVVNLNPYDIQPNNVYSLVYDGVYFQLNKPYVNDDLFNVKYYVEPTDYIVVPPYYQYWVYSDLEIAGELVNYGHVIIANGSMIMSGGTFSNYGSLVFVNLATGMTTSYNDSYTIQFTQSNTIDGASVSAIVRDGSLTASKLDTGLNGGATAGYVLSSDISGNFNWIPNSTLTASNGLSIISDNIILGGTLSQNTTINGDGYDLVIGGADYILMTSSAFDIEADFISIDSGTGSMQLMGDDIAISGNNVDVMGTFSINGTTVAPDLSPLSGQALIYDGTKFAPGTMSIGGVETYSDKSFVMTYSTSGNGQFSGLTISATPLSGCYVGVFVNGQEFEVGYGVTNSKPCYFSNDGGTTAKSNDITIGDGLYWNGSLIGTNLYITWRISLFYLL